MGSSGGIASNPLPGQAQDGCRFAGRVEVLDRLGVRERSFADQPAGRRWRSGGLHPRALRAGQELRLDDRSGNRLDPLRLDRRSRRRAAGRFIPGVARGEPGPYRSPEL